MKWPKTKNIIKVKPSLDLENETSWKVTFFVLSFIKTKMRKFFFFKSIFSYLNFPITEVYWNKNKLRTNSAKSRQTSVKNKNIQSKPNISAFIKRSLYTAKKVNWLKINKLKLIDFPDSNRGLQIKKFL